MPRRKLNEAEKAESKRRRAENQRRRRAMLRDEERNKNRKQILGLRWGDGDDTSSDDNTSSDEDESHLTRVQRYTNLSDKERSRRRLRHRIGSGSRIRRANMTEAEKAVVRERVARRKREKRANLTEAEKEVLREKEARRSREKRANMTEAEKEASREKHRNQMRENRASQNVRRKENPKEPRSDMEHAKHRATLRIVERIDRILTTATERKTSIEVRSTKLEKNTKPTLEAEVDDDLAWKDFMLSQVKGDFEKERIILCEEALEIELGPDVPVKTSRVANQIFEKPRTVQDNTITGQSESSTPSVGQESVARKAVQDRWKAAVNHDSDDDENNAIMNSFAQVQIKIEAEEYNEFGDDDEENPRRCENEVTDWIARVMTGDQNQQDMNGETRRKTTKSNAADQLQNIRNAPTKQARGSMLSHWKELALERAKEWKLEKLQKAFIQARQRWIQEKPEDSEKRIKVDEERRILKENIKKEKRAAIKVIVDELVHKRDMFSRETQTERENRIAKLHETIIGTCHRVRQIIQAASNIPTAEKKDKRKQNLCITKNLTKEEINSINATNARIRMKMQQSEYNMNLVLIAASGLPIQARKRNTKPRGLSKEEAELNEYVEMRRTNASNGTDEIGNISTEKFEAAFRIGNFWKAIDYYTTVNVLRLRAEVVSYRNFLLELLSKRRKRIPPGDTDNIEAHSSGIAEFVNPVQHSDDCQYEWISLPEEKTLQDIQKFKDFMSEYGEPVKQHLEFKRFYMYDKLKEYGNRNGGGAEGSPDAMERFRIKSNEKIRRRYIKNKYGIILGEGEYFDKKTMSAVKRPPKVYLAWQRKKGIIPPEVEENNSAPPAKKQIRKSKKIESPRMLTRRTTIKHYTSPASRSRAKSTTVRTKKRQAQTHDDSSDAESISTSSNCSNDDDYSNSNNGFADSNSNASDQDDGFAPLGLNEIDSVIRNDILNCTDQSNQLSQSQCQQFSSGQNFNLRGNTPGSSGNLHISQTAAYGLYGQSQHHIHQIPQLQLVSHVSSQMQWNSTAQGNTTVEPSNYGTQYVPMPTVNSLQNQQLQPSHFAENQQSYYNWNSAIPNTLQNQISTNSGNEMPRLQAELPISTVVHHADVHTYTPTSSNAADAFSSSGEEVEPPSLQYSPPKTKKRGRPKGSKNKNKPPTDVLHSRSSNEATRVLRDKDADYVPKDPKIGKPRDNEMPCSNASRLGVRKRKIIPGRRDIWNNLKRRKFYTNSHPLREPEPEAVVEVSSRLETLFERNPNQMREASLTENAAELLPKCDQCDKVVDSANALKLHMTMHHPVVEKIEPVEEKEAVPPPPDKEKENIKAKVSCPACNIDLNSVDNLIEHIFTVHFEEKQFICPFRKSTTYRCLNWRFDRNSLRNHIYSRHPIQAKTSWIMGINRPKDLASLERVQFVCVHCDEKCYETYSDLKDHYKHSHERMRYCCVHCGIYLRRADFWTDHAKLFHPDKPTRSLPPPVEIEDIEDLFRCAECDSEFSAQSFLDEHKAQGHTLTEKNVDDSSNKQKIFVCRTCDKQFRSDEQREDHSKTCADLHHSCYWCKCKMASEKAVQDHIKQLHPREPPVPENQDDYCYSHEPYKCEICQKSYMSLYSLRLHCIKKHQLHKYLQIIKEKNLTYPNPAPSLPEEIKLNPTKETENKNNGPDIAPQPSVSCPICNTTGHNLHQIHRHYDTIMKRYCIPCDRLFLRPNTLVQHNEAAHNILPAQTKSNLPSRCGIIKEDAVDSDWITCKCGLSFELQEFHRHHTSFEKDIRVCETCNQKFVYAKAYLDHIHSQHGVPINKKMITRTHKYESALNLKNKELTIEDYEKLSSITAMQTANGEVSIFSCKVCLKNFKTLQFLHSHIGDAHKTDAFSRVVCDKCNCTFASTNNLAKHNRYHHSPNLVRYKCEFCERLFMRMDHTRDHVKKIHPKEIFLVKHVKLVPFEEAKLATDFHCKICSGNFSTEIGLKHHMTNKHFPNHFSTFCEFCGLQINQNLMKNHIARNHQDKANPEQLQRKSNLKIRLGLPEIVEMIHGIYDKAGITYSDTRTKPSSAKNKIVSKRSSKKRVASKKKKKSNDYSSEEEEMSLSGTDEESLDEDAVFFMYSSLDDCDKDDADYTLYGEGENDNSDEEEEVQKISTNKRKLVKKDHSDTDLDGERKRRTQKSLKIHKTFTSTRPKRASTGNIKFALSDSDDDPDLGYQMDNRGSENDFRRMENKPKRSSARILSPSEPIVYKEIRAAPIMKELVLRLERCDNLVKQLSKTTKSEQLVQPTPTVVSLPDHPQVGVRAFKSIRKKQRNNLRSAKNEKFSKSNPTAVHLQSGSKAMSSPQRSSNPPPLEVTIDCVSEDDAILIKDEVDDIEPHTMDINDVNTYNLCGLSESISPSNSNSWKYINIVEILEDDPNDGNEVNDDPLS